MINETTVKPGSLVVIELPNYLNSKWGDDEIQKLQKFIETILLADTIIVRVDNIDSAKFTILNV